MSPIYGLSRPVGHFGLRHRSLTRGFTLVELIVTLILVGILAVAILPRLDLLRGFDEVGFRDALRSTLQYARKVAVAQRRNVQVSVTASGVSVLIASDIPEGGAALNFDRPLPLPGRSDNQISAPSGVTVSPVATVVFSPLGRPSAGAVFTVTGAGQVTVEAETGHVY